MKFLIKCFKRRVTPHIKQIQRRNKRKNRTRRNRRLSLDRLNISSPNVSFHDLGLVTSRLVMVECQLATFLQPCRNHGFILDCQRLEQLLWNTFGNVDFRGETWLLVIPPAKCRPPNYDVWNFVATELQPTRMNLVPVGGWNPVASVGIV